jgi:hypothetical protein
MLSDFMGSLSGTIQVIFEALLIYFIISYIEKKKIEGKSKK